MMKKLAAAILALSGCASSETDGAFHVEGRLVDRAGVSHVVASSPSTAKRIVADVAADGSFDIALDPRTQWVLTFTDWKRTGADMQVATLQANGLDALVPQTPGSVDLGNINIKSGRAHGSVNWEELLIALGLDDATATRMGRTDNLALRYANPDIDNDGTIDALQYDHQFRLDISGSFKLTSNGKDATVFDLVNGYAAAGIRYTGTTIQAVVPRPMTMNMASGKLMFEQPFYGSAMGPSTPMIAPGTEIGAPHVKFGELDGNRFIGVHSRAGKDAPSGAYHFGFDGGHLTFSDVNVPAAQSLESAKDYAVPFLRIRTTDASCKAECDIGALELDWRRMTADGWQPAAAQPARIDMAVKLNGRSTYLGADLTSASLAWSDMPVANTGILMSELAYVQTSEICFVQVSYETELGMKMTTQVANPACY